MGEDWLAHLTDPTPGKIATGGIAIAVLYKILRLLRADRRSDRQGAMEDRLRDGLEKDLGALRGALKELNERCDRFASERNTLIAENATLAARNEFLRARLEEAIAERDALEACLYHVEPPQHDT